ncbi:MAG: SDR family oxidoreductase [Candidatus Latescibacteria bacterium]|nr:SDR family oxidoreductase [Candidatus Latescibacterota bacterium]
MSNTAKGTGRVAGKAAIVTGAASGIGEATALLLAREGAKVAVVDVDAVGGERVAARIRKAGGEALFIRADVGKAAQVKGMIGRAAKAFGRLDIIHNNAIWFRNAKATELDEADWDRTLDVGLKSIYLAAKYGVPVLNETGGGTLINTASVHSLVGFAGHTAYDSVKAGILGLTRVLALDFGPEVRVNAVLPGAILTPLWKGVTQKAKRRFAEMVPAKRLGTPEDIAWAVLYLASDEASFVTGTTLVVDGGLLARTM